MAVIDIVKNILSTLFLGAFSTYNELNNANLPSAGVTAATNTVLITMLCALFTYGWFNVSKASDLESIHSALRGLQESNQTLVKQNIAASLRSQSRRLCMPHTLIEIESINREIDRLQEDYRIVAGEQYNIPEVCI